MKDRKRLLWIGLALASITLIARAVEVFQGGAGTAIVGRWHLQNNTTPGNIAYPREIEFLPTISMWHRGSR